MPAASHLIEEFNEYLDCLTVYLIVLFPVKYLNRLLTIHQTISLLNLKLTNYSVNSCAALSVDNSSNTGVRDKIRWSKFTMENILASYASPIAEEVINMNLADYNSLANSAEQIKNLKHSAPLVTPVRNNKISKKVFFRLPDDVKSARLQGRDAFDSWKQLISHLKVMFTKPIAPHGKNIGRNCAAFWTKPKLTE